MPRAPPHVRVRVRANKAHLLLLPALDCSSAPPISSRNAYPLQLPPALRTGADAHAAPEATRGCRRGPRGGLRARALAARRPARRRRARRLRRVLQALRYRSPIPSPIAARLHCAVASQLPALLEAELPNSRVTRLCACNPYENTITNEQSSASLTAQACR